MHLTQQVIQKSIVSDMSIRSSSGACVTFCGIVRDHDHGRKVLRLMYQAYEALAEKEMSRIVAQAKEQFKVAEVFLLHRFGELTIGEIAVAIAVQSAHRQDAFAACQYVIDTIKARVPIWKKEFYADGTVSWVHCNHG